MRIFSSRVESNRNRSDDWVLRRVWGWGIGPLIGGMGDDLLMLINDRNRFFFFFGLIVKDSRLLAYLRRLFVPIGRLVPRPRGAGTF